VLRYSTCRYSILVNTEETGGEFITVGGFVRPGTPGQRLSDQTTWYTAVAQLPLLHELCNLGSCCLN